MISTRMLARLFVAVNGLDRGNHGRSQDFSKGGSHCVKQRVLAFSQPEYCRLFALKKAYKEGGGGGHGHPASYALGDTSVRRTIRCNTLNAIRLFSLF